MVLTLPAYAKINLGLRILRRRLDGYHDIITVFQRILLADKVVLDKAAEQIIYEGPNLTASPGDNLCIKAARLFQTVFGADCGVKISLNKQIPVGAGLGGGSSDAAAVLRGMAQLNGIQPEDPRLKAIAPTVGSDVLFFLADVPAAIGEGKGEIITPNRGLATSDWVVIVWPGFGVSTADAYRKADETLTFSENDIKIIIYDFLKYQGGTPTAGMTNDFEPVVFAAHPELTDVRNRLLQAGARFAGLCGSGSSLFGVFDGETQGRAAARGWRLPWLSFVCRPC